MKKHNSGGGNDRKKPTQAEITRRNREKDIQAKQARTFRWEDLNARYNASKGAFASLAPAVIIIGNTELHAKMGDDANVLRRHAEKLLKHQQHYEQWLEEIRARHATLSGVVSEDDMTGMVTLIEIGQAYDEWTFSYNTVVTEAVNNVLRLAETYLNV